MISLKSIVLLSSFLSFSSLAFGTSRPAQPKPPLSSASFPLQEVEKVVVTNMSGQTTLTAVENLDILVMHEKVRWSETDCSYTTQVLGKTLTVEVKRKNPEASGLLNTISCEINLTLKLPSHTEYTVNNGSGNVDVRGMKGNSDITSGSGNVTLHTINSHSANIKAGSGDIILDDIESHAVDVKSGSGNINISGTMHTANISTGSGAIQVAFKSVPTEGSLSAKVGSGNTTLSYPAATNVHWHFKTGSGTLHSDFTSLATAPHQVTVESGSGNLAIRKR